MNPLETIERQLGGDDREAWEIVHSTIHCDPGVMDGLPVFIGTRVPVRTVLDCLAEDMEPGEILKAFPTLEPRHIVAALKFSSLVATIR